MKWIKYFVFSDLGSKEIEHFERIYKLLVKELFNTQSFLQLHIITNCKFEWDDITRLYQCAKAIRDMK